MGLSKLIGLVCLCFIFEAKLIHSNEINRFALNWTNTFNISTAVPLILKSNATFIRIACEEDLIPSRKALFIITPIDSSTSCVVPANEKCPYEIYAVALGNGKIVIEEYNPQGRDKDYINIVNPRTCTNKTFGVEDIKSNDIQFIPYNDTFDLYRGGDVIYRYTDEGILYDTVYNTSLNMIARFYTFFTFKAGQYFSVGRLDDVNSEIWALNSTYRRTETFNLNHGIGVFSTEHDKFGLCCVEYPNGIINIQCKILDSGFKPLVNATSIKFDGIGATGPIINMAVHNTMDGGAIVVYTISKRAETALVYYSRIHPDGSTGDKNILIAENDGDRTEIHIQEINAATNEYCIYLASKQGFLYEDKGVVKAYCNNA